MDAKRIITKKGAKGEDGCKVFSVFSVRIKDDPEPLGFQKNLQALVVEVWRLQGSFR